jgi:hypothetical protein
MAASDLLAQNGLLIAIIGVLGVYAVLQYDPTLFGLFGRRMEGFEEGAGMTMPVNSKMTDNRSAASGSVQNSTGMTTKNTNVSKKPKQIKATGDGYRLEPFEDDEKDQGCPSGQHIGDDGTCEANIESKGGSSPPPAAPSAPSAPPATPSPAPPVLPAQKQTGLLKEGFADLASMEGPAAFGSAEAPAGCYPRAQLTPVQLLPADQDSIYAQQNPMGVGSLKGKNFLSAGALIGVNTVGQTLRNANLQLRSEPPNPQVSVSIFNQSTIQSDVNRRPLEVGCT